VLPETHPKWFWRANPTLAATSAIDLVESACSNFARSILSCKKILIGADPLTLAEGSAEVKHAAIRSFGKLRKRNGHLKVRIHALQNSDIARVVR
jgi:hypothetical protein